MTAQRHDESIQKVGITITDLSPEKLAAQKIAQPVDLTKAVPGLNVVNGYSDAAPVFAIRGIGLEDATPNNTSGVGVYIDDIYQSGPAFLTTPFIDVKRIEVLEGPQGTLYGRNTTGGAINVISNGPTQILDGYANLGFGSWNTVTFDGAVGGPVSDSVGYRIATAIVEQGKGFQSDQNSSQRVGRTDHATFRGTIAYSPDNLTKFSLDGYYFRDRSTPQTAIAEADAETKIDAASGITPGVLDYMGYPIKGLISGTDSARKVHVGAVEPYIHTDVVGVSARISRDLGFANLLSITGYGHNRTTGYDNADGTAVAEADVYRNYSAAQFSQELRLTSNPGGPVKWVVGASYGYDRMHNRDGVDNTFTILAVNAIRLAELDADYLQTTRSYGVYANADAEITDKLHVIGGARFSHDERSFDGVTRDRTGLYTGTTAGAVTASLDETHHSSNVSYKVGLNYQATPKIMAYADVASGYKAGVFFGYPSVGPAWGYVKPERVTSFEGGIKSRFFGDRLQVNLAGYHTDYTDRQTTAVVVQNGLYVFTLGSVPRSKINGFEGNVDVKLARSLTLEGGVSYIDAYLASDFTAIRGLLLSQPDTAGTALPHAPDWSYNLGLTHDLRLGDVRVDTRVAYHWTGKQLAGLGDANALYGPNQTLDLSVKAGRDGSHWSVEGWVQNLTNNQAYIYTFTDFLGEKGGYLQRPISLGATLHYKL